MNRELDLRYFLKVDDYAYLVLTLASKAHSNGLNCQQATEVVNNTVTRAYKEGNGVLPPLMAAEDGLGDAP